MTRNTQDVLTLGPQPVPDLSSEQRLPLLTLTTVFYVQSLWQGSYLKVLTDPKAKPRSFKESIVMACDAAEDFCPYIR